LSDEKENLMSFSVKDFVGTWNVKWVDGQKPWFQRGWSLLIATDERGAKGPWLNGEYETCLGFTVLDGDQEIELSTRQQEERNQPIAFLFRNGGLFWEGFYKGQPLWIRISLAESRTVSGDRYLSLYGSTTWGDPEQVGVWGADGTGG
jgi:hypothetical protein